MSAINALSRSGATAAAAIPISLDAERARYEIQLADWTHSSSAKTPEGKAKIAALAEQLATVKARVQRAQAAHQVQPQATPPATTAHKPAEPKLGGHVDLYA